MKILVIGAGNMGLTYAQGMSKSKLLKKKNIMILDNSEESIIILSNKKINYVNKATSNETSATNINTVIAIIKWPIV